MQQGNCTPTPTATHLVCLLHRLLFVLLPRSVGALPRHLQPKAVVARLGHTIEVLDDGGGYLQQHVEQLELVLLNLPRSHSRE